MVAPLPVPPGFGCIEPPGSFQDERPSATLGVQPVEDIPTGTDNR